MGRQDYHQTGYGYTEKEARRNAIEQARDEYGHQDGYSGAMNCSTGECDKVKCIKKPKLAKSCKVEKTVQKGARKWETVFIIEPCWGFETRASQVLRNSTQGQAIAKAKELALKDQVEYSVRIDKRLIAGDTKIATVIPKKSEKGIWEFSGIARC